MAVTERARSLLEGAYDLHIHSAPDIMPRKGDDLVFARRAAEAKMAGIIFKSHYVCTADRAKLVNQIVTGTTTYGAISLNHSVGALNPIAVDVAGRSGARLVWFPTVDAENEVSYLEAHPEGKKPYWYTIQQELRSQGMSRPPFSILDENGKLLPVVYEILDAIAHHDMILATGHLSVKEILAILPAAKERKVQRIVATHPEFPSIAMPDDIQQEVARQGVILERCYTTPHSGKCTWEAMIHSIRLTGPSANILSTDLGQPNGPYPDEGLADFIDHLLAAGFTEAEIRTMTSTNPGNLVRK